MVLYLSTANKKQSDFFCQTNLKTVQYKRNYDENILFILYYLFYVRILSFNSESKASTDIVTLHVGFKILTSTTFED